MERWVPGPDDEPRRRGYKRAEDPLKTPRWPFQTIVTAAVMVLTEHADGNIEVSLFVTLSAREQSEREVVTGVLQVLEDAPTDAELVTWSGMMHDCPLLTAACLRHGLTLPRGWGWLAFGGGDPVRHLDLARVLSGGFKMKPVHMAEILAACDIPAKITVPAFAVAGLIKAGRWNEVQEACECDVVSTALLRAHWRKLHDPRARVDMVVDRILRRVGELREGPAMSLRSTHTGSGCSGVNTLLRSKRCARSRRGCRTQPKLSGRWRGHRPCSLRLGLRPNSRVPA